MKLTNDDICYLRDIGVDDEDFEQIGEAADCTKYTLLDNHGNYIRAIGKDTAIKYLGRECWLNGISRSAFHCTCIRENGNYHIYFNSKQLFK